MSISALTTTARPRKIDDCFPENIRGAVYSVDHYSALYAGKKALIAAVIAPVFFIRSGHIAKGIEAGIEYDAIGRLYHSVVGIVWGQASPGFKKSSSFLDRDLPSHCFFYPEAKNSPVISKLAVKQ